ncbi:hypothetical protein [Candidatus Mesenet endosymbiont of Agriotes lineatus]
MIDDSKLHDTFDQIIDYERYYDPSNFDSFTLTLVSAGVVNLKTIQNST